MNIYMEKALEQAYKAYEIDEVPIGCVITLNDEIVGTGFNNRETNIDITGHAELNAIREASTNIGSWKLDNCEMYVTVEPCLMCYGAILQSRIKKVYIGSVQDSIKPYSYKKYVSDDLLIEEMLIDEAKEVMQTFFKKRR